MKKITLGSLLMVSSLYFAKTEEPKKNTELPKKEEKVLVAKKNFKDEKADKIELKVFRTPFQQCVLNNSISIFAAYYVMGIPVDGDFIQAAATVQCMSDFDILP